jgi:hypothetical protein
MINKVIFEVVLIVNPCKIEYLLMTLVLGVLPLNVSSKRGLSSGGSLLVSFMG